MENTKKFAPVATVKGCHNWDRCTNREQPLYPRPNDIRSDFLRDNHRIIHCTAYRRLKHKTQVFFATSNDHICTRIEHVNIVQSVSETIAKQLGLNTELTNAISIGHDLGHAPFGHHGEMTIKAFAEKLLNVKFWHEKNSLRLIDDIETLVDDSGNHLNLDLTYAVRDGIICHCGEVDQNGLMPRDEDIDLRTIETAGVVQPYTWEGCVVKVSDKISYLGRDIDDARYLGLLNDKQINELQSIFAELDTKSSQYSNTRLMHKIIIDLCDQSSPDKGINLSNQCHDAMAKLKAFNYKHIYKHKKIEVFKKYITLMLNTIVEELLNMYDGNNTIKRLQQSHARYPNLTVTFKDWLLKYSLAGKEQGSEYKNAVIYDLSKTESYQLAVLEYVAGMTDAYAIKVFNEIVTFQ